MTQVKDEQAAGRPLPAITPLSEPFWNATREGRLTLQKCQSCGRFEWTPQMVCSWCFGELVWAPVSGRGRIYTYSVVDRPQSPGFRAPYVVAIVELDEGPRMLTDLIDADPAAIAVGLPVEVSFETVNGIGLYHFRPASPSAE